MVTTNIHTWKAIAGIASLSFIGIILFVLLPHITMVYEKYSALRSQNEQIKVMGNWKEQLANIESKQEQLDEGIDQMYVSLINENEFSEVVKQVFNEANLNNVSIHRVQPVSEENDGEYIRKRASLELQGSYHSLAQFINNLEQSGVMIETQSINITRSENSPGILNGTLDIKVTLLGESQ